MAGEDDGDYDDDDDDDDGGGGGSRAAPFLMMTMRRDTRVSPPRSQPRCSRRNDIKVPTPSWHFDSPRRRLTDARASSFGRACFPLYAQAAWRHLRAHHGAREEV